jgi:membrane protein implicated in regulation of membrane protease activity
MAPYYYWFLGGIILLILEMLIPGLVVIFFGFGAVLTGILTAIFDLPVAWEIVVFIVSSVLSLIAFRKYFLKKFNKYIPEKEPNDMIGYEAVVIEDIKPNMTGKVLFREVPWKATAKRPIKKGEAVKIIESDNLTLFVQPLNGEA